MTERLALHPSRFTPGMLALARTAAPAIPGLEAGGPSGNASRVFSAASQTDPRTASHAVPQISQQRSIKHSSISEDSGAQPERAPGFLEPDAELTGKRLNDFEHVLLSKRAEILRRQHAPITVRVPEKEEQAAILAGNENQAIQLDRDRRVVAEIDAALDRIRNGGFGVCLDCDLDIHEKRLVALPWACRCIRCQEVEDQRVREEAAGVGVEAGW
jgi:DnaK suppressor protein